MKKNPPNPTQATQGGQGKERGQGVLRDKTNFSIGHQWAEDKYTSALKEIGETH